MFQLNNLVGLVKKRKRVGRGGSRGGTSGKGNKGQKARSGAKIGASFEGGQMPIYRRLPKRGFNNARFAQEVEIISIDRLENVFNAGDVVTRELLLEKGIINGRKGAVLKVLGGKKLSKKLVVTADAFSESAMEAIKKVGGEVKITGER